MPTTSQWPYRIYQQFWAGFDWLFPPTCLGCGKPGLRWCSACQQNAQRCLPPICPKCGQAQASSQTCTDCRRENPGYVMLRSWGYFNGPLRAAIHQLKYKRDITLGVVLARPLIELVADNQWNFDYVTPVPLSAGRLKERGYNQVSFLARPLALAWGVPLETKALWRTRETHSQVGLNAEERFRNMEGAFAASPALAQGKDILLVDDVTTTGATLNACASALLTAGARNVYGLTLARAVIN